jgi:hypothetical protein
MEYLNEQLEDNKQIFRITIECVEGENKGRDIFKEFVVTDGQVPDGLEKLVSEMVNTLNDNEEVF